ncbi:MAG: DUF2807 domain-containing protein [Filimonas sp.]|nr:DUF2807 domain-containing protein [Filimonas sp.]
MKKLFLFLLLSLSVAGSVSAQTTINDANAEVRSVGAFTGLSVATGIKVYVTQSSSEAVAISASTKEYRDKIVTEVVNGVLKIYYKSDWKGNTNIKNSMQLKAYVSVKTLNILRASSGSNLEVKDKLSVGDIDIDISSGANVRVALSAGNVKVRQGSGAVSKFSGNAKSLDIAVNSGANFDGEGFAVDVCDADASSGGRIDISVNKELSASASSGGDIRYSGSATIKKVSNSSGGSIKKAK